MAKKEDLRKVKTIRAIKEAFMYLVKTKGYNKVTVSEIASVAKINRNTFYLHYLDKEQLVNEMVSEIIRKFEETFSAPGDSLSSNVFKMSEARIIWGFRNLLLVFEEDMEFYKIIFSDPSLVGHINILTMLIKNNLANLLSISNAKSNLVYEYSFSGMIGLIQQWILYRPTTINETSRILGKLAYTNLEQFKMIN